MNTRDKPTIVGERVILRPLGPDDAPDMFESLQDEEGMRLTGTRQSFTFEQIERWCAKVATEEGRIDCAIVDRSSGQYVGEAVLNEIDEDNLNANFRIALKGSSFYGRGYGTEASRLLVRYGFEKLGLHRIELGVYAFNPRAMRVYEKVGFRREGVRREVLLWDGRYFDSVMMSILRHEFEL